MFNSIKFCVHGFLPVSYLFKLLKNAIRTERPIPSLSVRFYKNVWVSYSDLSSFVVGYALAVDMSDQTMAVITRWTIFYGGVYGAGK